MTAIYDPAPRLARLEALILNGEPCWPLEGVCLALHAPEKRASRLVPPDCKRYVWREITRFDRRRYCYITAEGVRLLGLRYSRVPLHRLLAALAR